jgi:nucleoside-diphosphate-sugar epimerase
MAKLMVIGGSGFFGKSILDAFHRGLLAPWEIDRIMVVARNACNLKLTHPNLLSSSIELLDMDISKCKELPYADFVIHAAASSDASNYLLKPMEERRNIQAAVYNYCSLAKRYHQNSKIVYCSSGAIYGQQPPLISELREDSDLGPIEELPLGKRDYASAKRDAEISIQELGISGINVGIARCFAFVGPHLRRDQHFAIGNFIEDGINQRPILVNATHEVVRSYMYADDLVVWLMTLASHSNNNCPTINVGSDEAINLGDLAKKIADYFEVPAQIPEVVSPRIDRYVPALKKARDEMGLSLRFDLDASIFNTVNAIQ